MSELLFLKTIGDDYITKSVRKIESYMDTHNVRLIVEFNDTVVKVYDNNVLLICIQVMGV